MGDFGPDREGVKAYNYDCVVIYFFKSLTMNNIFKKFIKINIFGSFVESDYPSKNDIGSVHIPIIIELYSRSNP